MLLFVRFVRSLISRWRLPGSQGIPVPCDDAMAAVYNTRFSGDGRGRAVVDCDPNNAVTAGGLSFGEQGFHPWVAALREYDQGKCRNYEGSILQWWHTAYRPETLAEYMLQRASASTAGNAAPTGSAYPFGFFRDYKSAYSFDMWCVSEEAKNYDAEPPRTVAEGAGIMGPKTLRQGTAHFRRLVSVYESIKLHGYRRTADADGDIRGLLLRSEDTYRILVYSGQHRAAALAALRVPRLPVRLLFDHPVESRDADAWPLVLSGDWNVNDAVDYFNGLFDDSTSRYKAVLDTARLPVQNDRDFVDVPSRLCDT